MFKVAAVIWIMLGTVLAGIGVIAVLSVPQLTSQSEMLIPLVALVGYGVAMPVSAMVAKRILAGLKAA